MPSPDVDSATVLADCAFGHTPWRWPLPSGSTPQTLWLRAVAAGGQGRYGSALADLARLTRADGGGPFVSLAHSTRASFLRQLGWHSRAAGWDGRALAVAGPDVEAASDALIGLAADALGTGRFGTSARLLERAGERCGDAGPTIRVSVRLEWVSAELAMASGNGAAAVGHAERAAVLAAALGSARHIVKTDVILAAALCSAGMIDRSRLVADAALDSAERLDLIPLRWALACLLGDIGSGSRTMAQIAEIRRDTADAVHHRGGVWEGR